VYVPTRSGDNSDRLREYVDDADELVLIPCDLSDEAEVMEFCSPIVAEEGHIDCVVVSVGSFYYGYSMHRMPRADWDQTIQENLHTHFNVQRVFIDQFRTQNSGTYVVLIGPEADSVHPDWIPARDLGPESVELIGGHVPAIHQNDHEIRNRDHRNALLSHAR
jgi:NAD(P)-dependent dehydrogenase (short-subunit alcohol dehydrogenase family)